MHSPKRLKITDVNPHLLCVLCGGYYIDATTIIECLHSFCKSCIVKYLEKNKYCPICDVQIHKTFPLLNIRSDRTLQNIVYKLVPNLFKDEMQRRVAFYEKHPKLLPNVPEDRGEISDTTPILFPDETLVICLEYQNDKNSEQFPKRYLHCPANLTVSHLVKLIKGKFELTPLHQVNIFFKDDFLQEYIAIMDIFYTYQCRRNVPIHLNYRILELKKKTIKLLPPIEVKEPEVEPKVEVKDEIKEENKPSVETEKIEIDKLKVIEENKSKDDENNEIKENEKKEEEAKPPSIEPSGWKEVQLQISENGVMSVRNMSGKSSECSPRPAVEAPLCNTQPASPSAHPTANMTTSVPTVFTPFSSNNTTITAATPMTTSAEIVPTTSVQSLQQMNGPVISLPCSKLSTNLSSYTTISRPSTQPIVSVSKVSKDQVKRDLNTMEVNKLSISRVPQGSKFREKGDVLNKIVSKLSPNERVIGNTGVTIRPVVSTPKVNATPQHNIPPQQQNKPQKSERKPQQTVKYKTLTSPSKQWNPSIDRSTMLTLKQNCDMTKPPRFFKMRNMPRYLGNPASGVKPMYGGGEDASKDQQKPRSPTKLPPPYTPGSPKTQKPPFADKTSWTPRIPSPAHTGSFLPTNPYHLLYSGFPGYSNHDSSLLANANPELLRSMCTSTAFHPSLPPSISMLFNPLHNHLPRPSLEAPPSVQRIPRSKSPLKIEDKPEKSTNHLPTSSSSEPPKMIAEPPKSQSSETRPLPPPLLALPPPPPASASPSAVQPPSPVPLPPPPPKSGAPPLEKMDCCETSINNNISHSKPEAVGSAK